MLGIKTGSHGKIIKNKLSLQKFGEKQKIVFYEAFYKEPGRTRQTTEKKISSFHLELQLENQIKELFNKQ